MAKDVLDIHVERNQNDALPTHHIIGNIGRDGTSYWASWVPSLGNTPREAGTNNLSRTEFRNPWPSWHKPTQKEVWDALHWTRARPDQDAYIKLATSHLQDDSDQNPQKLPRFKTISDGLNSISGQAARLLQSEKPDFTFDPSTHRAKVTWLGHASMLLQLPPLEENDQPLCCLFDPIFSLRCSPSKLAGPARSYPPPCSPQSLPPVDVVLISHNHYDHLDYDSITALWKFNKNHIRFLVPLGNAQWFVDCGIPADRVSELDWWESAHLSRSKSDIAKKVTIWCTPAQHSSGRSISDTNSTLWSSWYITSPGPRPCRVFFAGDSGYQFHDSPEWPPSPSNVTSTAFKSEGLSDTNQDEKFPVCPIYTEIASRLGVPHLLLLPVSVGATYSYFRSFTYLPDSLSPFPHHSPGLTAAAHMPPWDAVRVLRVMTYTATRAEDGDWPVAIAMHWGTFVPEPTEILMTLGQLEWACKQHNVAFSRSLVEGKKGKDAKACFLVLNHGQSVDF